METTVVKADVTGIDIEVSCVLCNRWKRTFHTLWMASESVGNHMLDRHAEVVE